MYDPWFVGEENGVFRMLVLSRKVGERIQIGPDISIVLVETRPGRVKVGIDAPRDVQIVRSELLVAESQPQQKEVCDAVSA